MTVFVAHSCHDHNARNSLDVVMDLQKKYPKDTFICNDVAFWYLERFCTGKQIFEIETDLLMLCDRMILTTQPIGILKKEVEYARKIGLEVVNLAAEYRAV